MQDKERMFKMNHLLRRKQLNGKFIISLSLYMVELKHLKMRISLNFTASVYSLNSEIIFLQNFVGFMHYTPYALHL